MRYKTSQFPVSIKSDANGHGTLEGYASVFNTPPDSEGDVIAPGAYTDTLDAFLKDGFIAWQHDWASPVATPTRAIDDGHGLFIEAHFHSDEFSQRARTVAAERLARGKSMGLSIGYQPVRSEPGPNGTKRLTEIRLFEVSLVSVPAQHEAQVAGVKAGRTYSAPTGRWVVPAARDRDREALFRSAAIAVMDARRLLERRP